MTPALVESTDALVWLWVLFIAGAAALLILAVVRGGHPGRRRP